MKVKVRLGETKMRLNQAQLDEYKGIQNECLKALGKHLGM